MIWPSHSVRASIFANVPFPGAADLWQTGFGGPAQTFQPTATGSQATGLLKQGNGTLNVQPGRFDLTVQAVASPNDVSSTPKMIHLSSPPEAIEAVIEAVRTMAVGLALSRIALGVECSVESASTADAANEMAREVGLGSLPRTASDLIVQVNVPKYVKAARLDMNRVCKWSTSLVYLLQWNMDASARAVVPMQTIERPVRSLSLDLNSVPSPTRTLTPANTRLMWKALAAEAAVLLNDPHARLTADA